MLPLCGHGLGNSHNHIHVYEYHELRESAVNITKARTRRLKDQHIKTLKDTKLTIANMALHLDLNNFHNHEIDV